MSKKKFHTIVVEKLTQLGSVEVTRLEIEAPSYERAVMAAYRRYSANLGYYCW